jgi:hypothetical protein
MASNAPDPHEAIREAENALRDLLAEILEPQLGADWVSQSGLTPERLATLAQRKDEEEKRRPLQKPEERLLYYSDLPDLQKIIGKHWERFKPALGNRQETDVFLNKLNELRNPDAHQRGLWPYEQQLVLGISGHFRQAVAFSRKQVDELNKYYPRFERITDSFGFSTTNGSIETGRPIKAGDELTYRISAWNPEPEQPLEFNAGVGLMQEHGTGWTTADTLSVRIRPEEIERDVSVFITLRGDRTKRLRPHAVDHLVRFVYVGIPD